MPNVAYLFNTPFLTHDPGQMRTQRGEAINDFLEVMGPGDRLPVPWLCCFRPTDLKPVRVQTEDGNPATFTFEFPATTVKQAIFNLEQSLPLFEAMTRDSRLARSYLDHAIAFLRNLPLPYLLLDHSAILAAAGPGEAQEDIARAMEGDAGAIPFLKMWAHYEDDVAPYPPDVLSSGGGPDEARNQAAMAMDIRARAIWRRIADSASPDFEMLDTFGAGGQRDLRTVLDHVNELVRQRDPDGEAHYGYMAFGASRLARLARLLKLARPERMKLLLTVSTDELRSKLLDDLRLREELEGNIASQLRAICAGHGFEWHGFVIESNEGLGRRFENIDDWVTLPAMQHLPV